VNNVDTPECPVCGKLPRGKYRPELVIIMDGLIARHCQEIPDRTRLGFLPESDIRDEYAAGLGGLPIFDND
jgi:hypothetical protein